MQQPFIRSAVLSTMLMACGLCGCGKSGSNPIQFPEARFDVRPAGQATFQVDSLIGSGVNHTSVVGEVFTATAPFDFILENAAPPYQGTFTLLSGDQITVTLTVSSSTGQTQVIDTALVPNTSASVLIGGPLPPGTPGPSTPEVRFDLCAPLTALGGCSTTTDPGTFGVVFSGTLGDQFTSHVVNGFTPTIYFLEAARENVNGVFTRQPITGAPLQAQLFINGVLGQTEIDSGDVIVRQDL